MFLGCSKLRVPDVPIPLPDKSRQYPSPHENFFAKTLCKTWARLSSLTSTVFLPFRGISVILDLVFEPFLFCDCATCVAERNA